MINRATWLSDIHLNYLPLFKRDESELFASILAAQTDAVLIGGDLNDGQNTLTSLRRMTTYLNIPIYFVLGNHDYYHTSILAMRDLVSKLTQASNQLHWLPQSGIVELTPKTCLIGHDGWADGRYGDYDNSSIMLNDYLVIQELAGLDKTARLEKIKALGDEAARHFRTLLPEALAAYQHVIILTHVPPFKESCWHRGKISDDDALPHFACKAVGDVLLEVMQAHPDRQMTVLCGHTHGQGQAQILNNLLVLTSGTDYGSPKIERILQIE